MRVEVKLTPGAGETRVTVEAEAMTEEIGELIRRLSAPDTLMGFRGEAAVPLDPRQVLRCYAEDKGVLAQTGDGTYTLRERLYELEERLAPHRFVRISHSELVNLGKVERLDLSLTGTIRITLAGGVTSYVSRRYVKKIKTALGL